jgi:predicted branched-subunit amino acid permease
LGFLAGARAGLPVVFGYLGIGFAAGVVERSAGLSYAEILLLSTVLYAGSAQFVVASLLALGTPAPAIVSTVFFLNLRHLLLSAALAPALRGAAAWTSGLLGLQLTDETFVIASREAKIAPAWMAGLNLAAWSAWAIANVTGAALAGLATDTRALAFALPAMFAGLLVLQVRNPLSVVVAVFAAAAGLVFQLVVPGQWAVVAATLAGATLGLLLARWKSDPKS